MTTMTITEFKYWLEGVEEMQPENWTPDARQWARIREKIRTIAENEVISTSIQPTIYNNAPYNPPLPAQPLTHQQPFPQSDFALPNNLPTAAPPRNSLFGNPDTGLPSKTPNIDTTTGYETTFI